jgi:hypothetical protein
MTPDEWRAAAEPRRMLDSLRGGGVWDRKVRLWACACVRRVWHLLTEERSRRAVVAAERFADGQATQWQRRAAYAAASSPPPGVGPGLLRVASRRAALLRVPGRLPLCGKADPQSRRALRWAYRLGRGVQPLSTVRSVPYPASPGKQGWGPPHLRHAPGSLLRRNSEDGAGDSERVFRSGGTAPRGRRAAPVPPAGHRPDRPPVELGDGPAARRGHLPEERPAAPMGRQVSWNC